MGRRTKRQGETAGCRGPGRAVCYGDLTDAERPWHRLVGQALSGDRRSGGWKPEMDARALSAGNTRHAIPIT